MKLFLNTPIDFMGKPVILGIIYDYVYRLPILAGMKCSSLGKLYLQAYTLLHNEVQIFD